MAADIYLTLDDCYVTNDGMLECICDSLKSVILSYIFIPNLEPF